MSICRGLVSGCRVFVPAALIAVVFGCSDNSASTAPSSAPAETSASPVASASDGAAAIDDKEVKALVDAWVAAQNKGDFAAYEKLYAAKLEGIKRSGGKTWRFDRKGFLADRERMFKKPMTVEATDITVRASAASALVELRQRFKQEKFEDEGPKRLVVIREAGALRVTREEMIESTVGPGKGAGGDSVRFVMNVDGKPYVVLQTGDESWASGPAKLSHPGGHPEYLALRSADKAPPSVSSWKGRVLDLYDATGKHCEATVKDLALVAGGTPHFGEVNVWDGEPENGKPTKPVLSPVQRAAHVFAMGTPYLVADLDLPANCPTAIAIERKSPKFFERKLIAGAGDAAVRAAFRKLGSYAEAQKRFVDDYQGKGDWAKTVTVEAFDDGTRRFVAANAAEAGGCADFNAAVSALFEVTSDGKAVLVAEGIGNMAALFDSDGDGKLEILASSDGAVGVPMYRVLSGGQIVSTTSLAFPYNDCPC